MCLSSLHDNLISRQTCSSTSFEVFPELGIARRYWVVKQDASFEAFTVLHFRFVGWGAPWSGYLVPDSCYEAPVTLYHVPGSRHQVPGAVYLAPGIWYQAPGTEHCIRSLPVAPYLVPGVQHCVPGSWYRVPGTFVPGT